MFFKPVDLTTALRPSLLPDESLLFVQDAVGLYEGKYKIPDYQRGHAYLTSHRICYVDDEQPRKYSVAIDLKEIERVDYQAGFLRSSPKITIYSKPSKRGYGQPGNINTSRNSSKFSSSPSRSNSPYSPTRASTGAPTGLAINATWVCPICSFSNPVPSNFDPATANAATPIPPCLACGIKPPLSTLLKAAIASATNKPVPGSSPAPSQKNNDSMDRSRFGSSESQQKTLSCPRCTFANHASLFECEICGAPLKQRDADLGDRSDSPAPLLATSGLINSEITDGMKLSFRSGGDKIFHERLRNALIQRKWLLQHAPPIPSASNGASSSTVQSMGSSQRSTGVGIAGLERRGLQTRKNNEVVIGGAFEDLEALMASAKEIVALAETFAKESGMASNDRASEANNVLNQSAAALGMITTKDMLGSGGSSENLYLSELSRNLAEYLTDDRKGILAKEGGIMSLIDLWAVFNHARNGVELVSPSDFRKAAELWEKLKLPVRLRRFKSGLLVVQRFDWTDEKTLRQIHAWLDELRLFPSQTEVPWDWVAYERGITAQEAAERFGWSVGVAAEELEMAEDRGVLCREEGIEGLRFWRNHLVSAEDALLDAVQNAGQPFTGLTVS